MLCDLDSLERRIVLLEKKAKSGDKDARTQVAIMTRLLEVCARASQPLYRYPEPGRTENRQHPALTDHETGAMRLQRGGGKLSQGQ